MLKFCKYKYLYAKIASLAIVKSCVTVGPFVGVQYLPHALAMD